MTDAGKLDKQLEGEESDKPQVAASELVFFDDDEDEMRELMN